MQNHTVNLELNKLNWCAHWWEICHFSLVLISNACKLRLQLHIESVVLSMVADVSLNQLKLAFEKLKKMKNII